MADLEVIIGLIISGVLVVALTGMYYTSEIQSKSIPEFQEQSIINSAFSITTSFFAFLFIDIGKENPIIYALMTVPIILIVIVLGARYIRGQ